AAGYPACPDHSEKRILFDLLAAEENAGIHLTESFAMWPGASVSGLYFAHPEAKYFGVGKIGRDQVLDYQQRKGMSLEEVERWLGPYLNYERGQRSGQRSRLIDFLVVAAVHPQKNGPRRAASPSGSRRVTFSQIRKF